MNARRITAGIGACITLLGLFGLFFPGGIMDLVGFSPDNTNPAQALGETRAVYGGMLLAMGIYTILAGLDLYRNRRVIFLVALLFSGAAVGRALGMMFDGFPGVIGTVSIILEISAATLLGWASQFAQHDATEIP